VQAGNEGFGAGALTPSTVENPTSRDNVGNRPAPRHRTRRARIERAVGGLDTGTEVDERHRRGRFASRPAARSPPGVSEAEQSALEAIVACARGTIVVAPLREDRAI